MEKLFSTYSVSEIVMFLIFLAFAVKGSVTFVDWAIERIKKIFNKQKKEEDQKELIGDSIKELTENQKKIQKDLQVLTENVDMLIKSDKDSIKSYLTEKHHFFCYQQGWIDDYNLECCERRYSHYKDEGGNSFIESFMTALRELPNRPPEKKEKE